MSKTNFKIRLDKIESINHRATGHPTVIIKMWCPDGVSPRYTGGKPRVIASNAGEGEINE